MNKPNKITIDDVEYVRADSVSTPVSGTRVIAVLRRGWIMVGYKEKTVDGYKLTDCYNLRRWEKGGFGLATINPKEAKVQLDKCGDIEFPAGALIQFIPIADGWAR